MGCCDKKQKVPHSFSSFVAISGKGRNVGIQDFWESACMHVYTHTYAQTHLCVHAGHSKASLKGKRHAKHELSAS